MTTIDSARQAPRGEHPVAKFGHAAPALFRAADLPTHTHQTHEGTDLCSHVVQLYVLCP